MKRYIRSDIIDIKDEDLRDRLHQAEDFTTSRRVLERLLNDPEFVVRDAAERRLNSLDSAERFYKERDVPDFLFTTFADAYDAWARYQIACHPDTPLDILQKLAEDEDPRVRAAARSQLNQ